jgi:hypothetical protein
MPIPSLALCFPERLMIRCVLLLSLSTFFMNMVLNQIPHQKIYERITCIIQSSPHYLSQISDTTIIFFDIDKMSGKGKKAKTPKEATISPDHAAGDPDPIADTAPRRSSRTKRRQSPDGTETRPAAKVARLANAEGETKGQEGDATPDTSLTTEEITNRIKDLWSDDADVIERALFEIADIGHIDVEPDYENELKMRGLGVHMTVFQVLQKHAGCLGIQVEGMRALGNLSKLMPTKTLLGDFGCVEFILASMEKYLDSVRVQDFGCFAMRILVDGTKDNAERFEKSGGIAAVIAAMKAHPNSEELQKEGCSALSNMSEWEEYRPLIMDAGGASAIVSAMEKCDHPILRERAYEAMENLIKKPR